MSCVPTSPSISESVITSGPSPVLAGRLCAPCESALCVVLAALNLILDCPGLELAVAVHGGLPTGRPLPCVPCVLVTLASLVSLFGLVILHGVASGPLGLKMAQH